MTSRHTSSIPKQYVTCPSLLYSDSRCSQDCRQCSQVLLWLLPDIQCPCRFVASAPRCSWMPLHQSSQLWDSGPTTPKHSQRHPVTKIYFADAGCIYNKTFLYHHTMVHSQWYGKSSQDVELTRHQPGHHRILYQHRRYCLPIPCLLTKGRRTTESILH